MACARTHPQPFPILANNDLPFLILWFDSESGVLSLAHGDRYLTLTGRFDRLEHGGDWDKGMSVSNDINILALAKGEERYIFLYNEDTKSEALRTLGRYASNSELSFSWYDAAVLSQNVRQNTIENESKTESPQPQESLPLKRFDTTPLEDLFSGEGPIV